MKHVLTALPDSVDYFNSMYLLFKYVLFYLEGLETQNPYVRCLLQVIWLTFPLLFKFCYFKKLVTHFMLQKLAYISLSFAASNFFYLSSVIHLRVIYYLDIVLETCGSICDVVL